MCEGKYLARIETVSGRCVASCGHCEDVVYPDLHVLKDHDLRCENGVCVWYSRAMQLVVHKCDQPVESVEVHQTAERRAPIFV